MERSFADEGGEKAGQGFIGQFPRSLRQDIELVKLDYQLNQANHLNVVANIRDWKQPADPALLTGGSTSYVQDRFIIANWTMVTSNNKVNEFRYQWGQDHSFSGRNAATGAPQVVLMSSGSEVALVLSAAEKLAAKGVRARVVSMPSHELFAAQEPQYKRSVLLPDVPRVAIEAAHPMSWYRWVGSDGVVLGLDRFGASAPYEQLYTELGLTVEKIVAAAEAVIAEKK